MSLEEDRLRAFRCPACGGPLGGFPPDHTCVGVRCLACDWVGAVTTNQNRPGFDPTPYDVWVEPGEFPRCDAIARAGNALGIGVAAARRMLDTGQPAARGVLAMEVLRLGKLLRSAGLDVRVEPPFPWPWE